MWHVDDYRAREGRASSWKILESMAIQLDGIQVHESPSQANGRIDQQNV